MAITVLPWRHASELAFVRDCFYPHHRTSPDPAQDDIYTVHLPPDHDPDQDTATLPSSDPSTREVQTRIANYKTALGRVAIWNFKSPRNVPHAVAATAALIEAKMHDEQDSDTSTATSMTNLLARDADTNTDTVKSHSRATDTSILTEQTLKSIYAMAFLRFVNGFVDRDVSRSSHRTGLSKPNNAAESEFVEDEDTSTARNAGESSMYAFAAAIGMPGAFVDLRHRCVHGAVLPELSVLRAMGERALEWLWERWWRGNVQGDSGRWVWEMEMAMAERKKTADASMMEVET